MQRQTPVFGLIAVCLCLVMTAISSSAETLIWRKVPLSIDLVVGVEQMLMLPADGAAGLPPALANTNVFKTLATGGAMYWTALEPFENKRIQVRLDSGEYLLFDVTARTQKAPPSSQPPLHIALEQPAPSLLAGPAVTQGQGLGAAGASLFELIRYAAQELYSPKRLVAPINGVRAVPVGLSGNMTALYDQGQHPGLVVQPHKAWTAGGLYVTAFVVTNEHTHVMRLDNRKVRHATSETRNGVAPHFVASAFFDTELPPRSEPGNRTVLFVVTDRPIRQVVRGV